MIATLAAFLLAAEATKGADPRLTGLDLDGWDVAERGADGALTLTRPALGDQIPGFPQAWIRTERLGPPTAPSTLRRVEFNCAGRQMRVLEAYSYPLRNLAGDKHQLPLDRPGWRPLPAGVWPKPTFEAACNQ
jgi:hypothetical protein